MLQVILHIIVIASHSDSVIWSPMGKSFILVGSSQFSGMSLPLQPLQLSVEVGLMPRAQNTAAQRARNASQIAEQSLTAAYLPCRHLCVCFALAKVRLSRSRSFLSVFPPCEEKMLKMSTLWPRTVAA